MKIIDIKCPKCGGELHIGEGRKDCFCEYCGSHLFFDDGSRTITNVNVVRDEARIKEAEVNLKRLENTELEKHRIDKQTEAEIKKAKIEARASRSGSTNWFRNLMKAAWFVSLLLWMFVSLTDAGENFHIASIATQDIFNISFSLFIIITVILLLTHRR